MLVFRRVFVACAIALVGSACSGAPPAAPAAQPTAAGAASSAAPSPAAATTPPSSPAPSGSPSAAASPAPSGSPSAAASPAASAATPSTRLTVQFGGLGNIPDRALFAAQQLGYFDEQNLDVQVTTFQSASQMIPLMATGKLDAGNGGSSPAFFNALNQGIPLKIVSDVTVVKRPDPSIHGAQQIVVRKQLYDQGVTTLADLKGHSIAINTPGSLNQEQLDDSLRAVGLSPDDVQVQTVGFNDMLTAVTNGGVDAAVALEPFVTLGQQQNIWVPIYDVADATLGQTAEWLIYSDDFIKNNPEAGRRLILAYTKALRWLEDAEVKNEHRDQEIAILTANTSVKDPNLYAAMGRSYGETDARINMDQLTRDQQFYIQTGGQKQLVDPSQIVDTSFGDYARQTLGPYQ